LAPWCCRRHRVCTAETSGEAADANHEEVIDGEEVSAEDNEHVANGAERESDDSHESIMHRWCSAETVTFGLDESFEWHIDTSGEWPTASDAASDSGAAELL